MPHLPDDDLFKDSTMTFGEHLEELRGALFRSLAGLLVGFLIALPLASRVVRLIERPLQKGLRAHYVEKAKTEFSGGSDATYDATYWKLVRDRQLVPSTVLLDADHLFQQLMTLDSQRFREVALKSAHLDRRHVDLSNVVPLASRLIGERSGQREPAADAVRDLLSSGQRQQLRQLAAASTATEGQRDELLSILNAVIDTPTLCEAEQLSQLPRLFPDREEGKLAAAMRERLRQQPNDYQSARLNRLLLSRVFAEEIAPAGTTLMDIRTWQPADVQIQSLGVPEAFMIFIKAAVIVALVIASPWIFYQIWEFVAAGLYPHEKRFVYAFLPVSLGLFLAGACLAFLFVFEPVLNFLFSFNRQMNIDPDPRISEWMSFVLFLPIGFGISFQLPLVMLLLERIGMFTVASYVGSWRVAVLIIFLISMFLTPADPVSMLLMALPLTVLYFGGIAACRYLPQRGPGTGAQDPKA